MKAIKFAKPLVLAIALSLAAGGCHKHTTTLTPLPGYTGTNGLPDVPPAPPINPTEGGLSGTPSNDPNSHANWNEHPDVLQADTVYFAFDSSAIKEDEKSKVSAVADYLKSNTSNAVKVEGHCDERGTEEYNRALGERRALALREELIRLGIPPSRVDTITYGFNRPAVQGHDEAAWAKNRRGVFNVLTPPGAP